MIKYYFHDQPFELEQGGILENFKIAYHTYGSLNADADNVVWVCHALTANSDVADWWPNTVAPGRFLDPEKWFVVCANFIGSPYGTTAPLSENPATGEPYYQNFPKFTIRDIVAAHKLLAEHLGIGRINALIGCSVGGFQAIEWAVEEPKRFGRLVLLATDAVATPWTIAIDETQRMAILADPTWGKPAADAAAEGLAAARAIALLSYRGPSGYNLTQRDPQSDTILPSHRACTYQRYQGEKLVRRYNAYSYVAILDAFDTHDVGRGRGGMQAALNRLTMPTLVVGLTTDIVFPAEEMRNLASKISTARYAEIQSEFGHDGFLVESDQLNALLVPFLNE